AVAADVGRESGERHGDQADEDQLPRAAALAQQCRAAQAVVRLYRGEQPEQPSPRWLPPPGDLDDSAAHQRRADGEHRPQSPRRDAYAAQLPADPHGGTLLTHVTRAAPVG